MAGRSRGLVRMCRGKSNGGRRCPGCVGTKAKEAHNERRRANRAIRRNVAEWARQWGLGSDLGRELEGLQPNQVKAWVRNIGKDPDDFKDGVPSSGLPSGLEPAPGSLPMMNGLAVPAAGVPAAQPVPVGRGGGGGVAAGRKGGAGAGVAAAPSVPPAAAGPSWSREAWCTPKLQAQIEAVTAAQGVDRDERSMLRGSAVAAQYAHGGTNETRRVSLDNGMVGYHKPFDGLDDDLAVAFGQSSAQQSVHEAAAWQLASKMGPPWSEMVPPCVIREIGGRLGSFALERPGLPKVRYPENVPEWREAGFYDALIGQQDRHSRNYLVAGDRLALIDHGYAFARSGDVLNYSNLVGMRHDTDPVLSHGERQVLDRLLASPDLLGMRSILEPKRADALRARALQMRSTGRVLPPGEF